MKNSLILIWAIVGLSGASCAQPGGRVLCSHSPVIYERSQTLSFFLATDIHHVTTAAIADCPNVALDMRASALTQNERQELWSVIRTWPRDPQSYMHVGRVSARVKLLRPEGDSIPIISVESIEDIDHEQPPENLRAVLLIDPPGSAAYP